MTLAEGQTATTANRVEEIAARGQDERAEEPLVLAPLRGREDVADDRESDGEERAGAEALDAAGHDEPLDGHGQAGQDRAEQEDADAEEEDRPAPEQGGETAVERAA